MLLEAVLHYFHVSWKDAVASLPEKTRRGFLPNVNVAAAETFVVWSLKPMHSGPKVLKEDLLQHLKKFHVQLVEQGSAEAPAREAPKAEEEWIDFSKAEERPAAAAASAPSAPACPARLLPRVLEYDTAKEQPITKQEERDKGDKAHASVAVVPWKAWAKTESAQGLDKHAANHAAITLVLRAHHTSLLHQQQAVELVVDSDNKRYARAEGDVEEGALKLYPCAPKGARFHSKSDHPGRATFQVRATLKGRDVLPTETYYLMPELKLPTLSAAASAVAEGASEGDGASTSWQFTGDESLYPWWAVTRLSPEEMRKLQSSRETRACRFNMQLAPQEFAAVAVGEENLVLHVTVPVLTNFVALQKGERLFLEHARKAVDKKRPADTWKTEAKKVKSGKAAGHQTAPTAKAKAKGRASLEVADQEEI